MRRRLLGIVAALAVASCASLDRVEDTGTTAHVDSPLSFMFGEWVGTASGFAPDGTPYTVTQTERVGPMLDGDVVVIEGTGYRENGETAFSAFAVVSQSGPNGGWEMRSYANGRAGTFPFEPRENGFVWSTPAGPNARMRYSATFDGDRWSQVGEYVVEAQPPRQVFEMNLARIGPTAWPSSDPVAIPGSRQETAN